MSDKKDIPLNDLNERKVAAPANAPLSAPPPYSSSFTPLSPSAPFMDPLSRVIPPGGAPLPSVVSASSRQTDFGYLGYGLDKNNKVTGGLAFRNITGRRVSQSRVSKNVISKSQFLATSFGVEVAFVDAKLGGVASLSNEFHALSMEVIVHEDVIQRYDKLDDPDPTEIGAYYVSSVVYGARHTLLFENSKLSVMNDIKANLVEAKVDLSAVQNYSSSIHDQVHVGEVYLGDDLDWIARVKANPAPIKYEIRQLLPIYKTRVFLDRTRLWCRDFMQDHIDWWAEQVKLRFYNMKRPFFEFSSRNNLLLVLSGVIDTVLHTMNSEMDKVEPSLENPEKERFRLYRVIGEACALRIWLYSKFSNTCLDDIVQQIDVVKEFLQASLYPQEQMALRINWALQHFRRKILAKLPEEFDNLRRFLEENPEPGAAPVAGGPAVGLVAPAVGPYVPA